MKAIIRIAPIFLIYTVICVSGIAGTVSKRDDHANNRQFELRETFLLEDSWRNPFLTIKEIETLNWLEEIYSVKNISSREFVKLNAILISTSEKVAIINQRVLSEGDYIDNEKVLEINRDGVLLGKASSIKRLKLQQGGVKIKTTNVEK